MVLAPPVDGLRARHQGARTCTVVVAQEVIFTSFAPSGEACTAGGESWLYQARYDNGGGAGEDNEENLEDRVTHLGEGIAHPAGAEGRAAVAARLVGVQREDRHHVLLVAAVGVMQQGV